MRLSRIVLSCVQRFNVMMGGNSAEAYSAHINKTGTSVSHRHRTCTPKRRQLRRMEETRMRRERTNSLVPIDVQTFEQIKIIHKIMLRFGNVKFCNSSLAGWN